MNRNSALAQALGMSFGAAGNAYMDAQDQARIRQQQEADRQRQQRIQDEQMAASRAEMLRSQIGRLVYTAPETAAGMIPELYKNFNQAAHTNLKGPAILGATVTDQVAGGEQMRPNKSFMGPMPVATETKTHQDFSGSATQRAILGAIGQDPTAPVEVSPGATLFDRNTQRAIFTAPERTGAGGDVRLTEIPHNGVMYKVAINGAGEVVKNYGPVPESSGGSGSGRLVPSYNPDGTITYVQGGPGVTVNGPQKPAAAPKMPTDKEIWDEVDAALEVFKPGPMATQEEKQAYDLQRKQKFSRRKAFYVQQAKPQAPIANPTNAPAPGAQAGGTARWMPVIEQAAKTYGLPAELIRAVMAAESGGREGARSPVGAIGLMQLMPGTAKDLGVDPNDPTQNVMGGAKYLASLLKQFNGDVTKAVAAYNAGPGAVTKYGGIPPYKETQAYVKRVLARYQAKVNRPAAPAKGGATPRAQALLND